MALDDLLSRLLQIDGDDPHGSLDLLFDEVDEALWAGDAAQAWPDLEALLADARWSQASLTLLIGALTITLAVRHRITGREHIIDLVRNHPSGEGREEGLLDGLV